MLDIRLIREERERVEKALRDRGLNFDLGDLVGLDSDRRKVLQEVEALKNKRNVASSQIALFLKEKKDPAHLKAEMKIVSQKIDDLVSKVEELDKEIAYSMLNVPNLPHSSTPVGSDSKSNVIVIQQGEEKRLNFNPKSHIEIGSRLGILDLPRAAKITGSFFPLFVGDGARLQRALIAFMLDLHTKEHRYREVWPPSLVNRQSMTATGQLPKFEDDMYRLKDDDLFLVPTAEVPLTNLHRDEILEEEKLPLSYTAYTPCFRREAGSYGKETKGLIRVHQFDKVELVKFTHPERSYEEHETLLKDAEEVLKRLELPYRVVLLCTGDLGFAASKCYDLEAYAPGIGIWLEVSSCSNFEAFQARRANIRFRSKQGKVAFVHTLNGSGVALARTVICLLEQYQEADGSVTIPKALRPYLDGQERLSVPS